MARVRMKQHVSGGRQVDLENGTWAEWPHRGEILECSEQEAAELVRADLAEYAGCRHCGGDIHDGRIHGRTSEDGPVLCVPVPAATPASPVGTERAAADGTQEPPAPVRTRTAPRPRQAKP